MNFRTLFAIAFHIFLVGILYATANNTKPEDTLLTKADYPRQSAFVQVWGDRAEIAIAGARYELSCTPYRNDLNEWEAVETPTGDFVKIGENGTTTARIGGKYYTFLPE